MFGYITPLKSELKVKDLTHLKITNGKIEKYITGIENIETELK